MFVPRTADGIGATVGPLRSLDGSMGVSFHIFSLQKDLFFCVSSFRICRQISEEVREELETRGVCDKGVL